MNRKKTPKKWDFFCLEIHFIFLKFPRNFHLIHTVWGLQFTFYILLVKYFVNKPLNYISLQINFEFSEYVRAHPSRDWGKVGKWTEGKSDFPLATEVLCSRLLPNSLIFLSQHEFSSRIFTYYGNSLNMHGIKLVSRYVLIFVIFFLPSSSWSIKIFFLLFWKSQEVTFSH